MAGDAARHNEGKPDYSLVPMHLLEEVAHVFTYGASKYERWGWAKAREWSTPFACACRHLFAWYRGERNDPESGFSHLAHAIANMLILLHYERFYPEGDDRPVEYFNADAG